MIKKNKNLLNDQGLIDEQMVKSRIKMILVETETPGNLGASARAMKSMGFTQLRLIKPRRLKSRDALARAVNAEEVLAEAKVYEHLSLALADCQLTFGTSGQIESLDQTRYTPRQLAQRLCADLLAPLNLLQHKPHHPPPTVGIVFGRESRGLSREELSLCQAQVRIPSHPSCPSLNLASAVQIICYDLSIALDARSSEAIPQNIHLKDEGPSQLIRDHSSPLASHQQLEILFRSLESLAINTGALDPSQPRQMMRHLRELFTRATPRESEASLMISLLKRAQKSLRSHRDTAEL